MGKQLLFCVETNQQTRTDQIYISETIKHYYRHRNDIKIHYIYLNGKGNYNKPGIVKSIAGYIRQYTPNGPTIVLYCIDTDRYDMDPQQQKELVEIVEYCKAKEYELIWFCRDIEDVYWGEQISNENKKKKAAQFRSGNHIRDITESTLRKHIYARHYSNILDVLDKHLKEL